MLLDNSIIERLRTINLANNRNSYLADEGAVLVIRSGSSDEFLGYREYVPGDDVRNLDWNAYARLDKFYVRENMEIRRSCVNVFMDTSASMGFDNKLLLAKKIAAAISVITLENENELSVRDLSKNTRLSNLEFSGGRGDIPKAFREIEAFTAKEPVEAEGKGEIESISERIVTSALRPGYTFIISDFLNEDFTDNEYKMLTILKASKQYPILIQVLSNEEADPKQMQSSKGLTLNMIDSETGKKKKITLDRGVIERYIRTLNDFKEKIRKNAVIAGCEFISVNTGEKVEDILFNRLKRIYTL